MRELTKEMIDTLKFLKELKGEMRKELVDYELINNTINMFQVRFIDNRATIHDTIECHFRINDKPFKVSYSYEATYSNEEKFVLRDKINEKTMKVLSNLIVDELMKSIKSNV